MVDALWGGGEASHDSWFEKHAGPYREGGGHVKVSWVGAWCITQPMTGSTGSRISQRIGPLMPDGCVSATKHCVAFLLGPGAQQSAPSRVFRVDVGLSSLACVELLPHDQNQAPCAVQVLLLAGARG